jgi:hypothetical protein
MSDKFMMQMAFAGIMIFICIVFLLIDIYLALGLISPDLSVRIDHKLRKLLNKPAVIILDPWYIRNRNVKWFVIVVILFQVVLAVGALIIKFIE